MINKLIPIFIFIFSMCNLNAFEDADECKIFKEKLITNNFIYSLDEPVTQQWSNIGSSELKRNNYFFTSTGGVLFERVNNENFLLNEPLEQNYKRTPRNNIIVEHIHNSIQQSFTNKNYLEAGDEVVKINGAQVSSLSDNDIRLIMSQAYHEDGRISFLISRSTLEKIFEFNVLDYWITSIAVENYIQEITNIDSSSSTFDIRMKEQFFWKQFGLNEIGKEVVAEAVGSVKKFQEITLDKGLEPMFFCDFNLEEWKNMNMFFPNISILNSVDNKNINELIRFSWSYDWNPETKKIIENSSFYEVSLLRESTHTLKSTFDYTAFPFDSQNLDIEYALSFYGNYNPLIYSPFDSEIKRSIQDLLIYEWKIKGFNVSKPKMLSEFAYTDMNSHAISVTLEREFLYYLLKIYLPIIIILCITLSSLWISPKEIEARLEVSVVCFLALIAFTYIIDNEIPKLSYLTIMDFAVLLSYFFAGLPIVQSIVVHSMILKNENKALLLNKRSKRFIPFLYIASIVTASLLILLSSDNVISAFKF